MFKYDAFNRPDPETFYLCKPDGTPLCELNGIDADSAEMQITMNNQYELSFDYDRWINTLDGELVESNGYFDLTVEMRILVKSLGYFVLKYPPYEYDGDREKKSVTAYSCECELEKKDLVGFKINTGEVDSLEYLVVYDEDETEELLNAYTGLPYDYIMFDNTYPAQLQELLGKYNDGTTITNKEKIADIKYYCDLVARLKSRLIPETIIDADGDEYEDYQLVEFVEYTYDDDGNVKKIYLFSADDDPDNEYQVGFNGRIQQLIDFYTKYHDQLSLMPLAIEKCSCNWSVGEIDPSLANKKFQFNIDSENIYSFLTNDVASVANCVFTFDLFNKKVNAILVENIGEDSGVVLARESLLDTVNVSCDDDNLFTRYNVSGADDLTITQVNFGSSRIDDLTYFLNVRDDNNKRIYVTDELAAKYYQFAEDREIARDVYVDYTKTYNQLLIDIDELKYRVPNDVVQTDWDTFTLTELEEALKTYKNLLATLVSLYKEDYGSVGVNSDGSVKEQFIKDTIYWYDYYAYTVAIEQIEAAYEAKARDETYADIDNQQILDQINAWETEWSLYGTVELQNKIEAYNNQMKVLIDSGAVVTKYPPTADFNGTCTTQGTDAMKQVYIVGTFPDDLEGVIFNVDFSFKHSRSGGVYFEFTFEDGTVVSQDESAAENQEWTWFAGDTLYFKFTSNDINSLELIEDNGEIYTWDELYGDEPCDLTDDQRTAYLTEYMYMQINYHDEEYLEAYNLRNECQEYLDTLLVELEELEAQRDKALEDRTALVNLTTIEGYNRIELGQLVDLEDCPDSYVSATCDTEDGVVLKEVTISDGTLSDGDILAITFTYAQTKSTGVYFDIDGTEQDEDCIDSQKFTWDAGDTLYFVYHEDEPFESAKIAFTIKEIQTISMLYMDVDYSNENILTTSLDTVVTAIDAQLELLDDAREQLSIASQPQIEFTTEIDNLLAMAEFRDFDFTVGNYTVVEYYDDYMVKLRLYQMSYNPCIPENDLNVTFTNFIRSRSERSDLSYILEQASGGGSGGSGGGSGSGGTYGESDDIDVTISNTMLAQLLNSETFGTRVSNIILDTIDVNSLYSRTATFGGLGNGFTTIDGNCLKTGYIVSTNYNGRTTYNSNDVVIDRAMDGFSEGSIINLNDGTFNFGAGKLTGFYDDTYKKYILTVEGTINAQDGHIANWTITTDSIYAGVSKEEAETENDIVKYSAMIAPTNGTSDSATVFTAGGDVYDDSAAPFRVTKDGSLYATSGHFSGNSDVAGWGINDYQMYKNLTIDGSTYQVVMRSGESDGSGATSTTSAFLVQRQSGSSWSPIFRVRMDGSLYATSADISGTITAGSGSKIGPWTVSSNAIYTGSYNTNGNMYFGSSGLSISQNFVVDSSGNLTSKNATLSGTITAGSGSAIGPWNVSNTAIWKGSSDMESTSSSAAYFGDDGLSVGGKFFIYAANGNAVFDGMIRTNDELWIYDNINFPDSGSFINFVGSGQYLYWRIGTNGRDTGVYALAANTSGDYIGRRLLLDNTGCHLVCVSSVGDAVGSSNVPVYINSSGVASLCYPCSLFEYGGTTEFVRAGTSSSGTRCMIPASDGYLTLGRESYRWGQIWSTSSSITTSDERDKTNIEDINEQYENLFMELHPVNYMVKNFKEEDNHDRVHCGLIAQEVESACQDVGLNDQSFATLCHDELEEEGYDGLTDRYGIRYGELHGLEIHMIQKSLNAIKELEKELEQAQNEISELKSATV